MAGRDRYRPSGQIWPFKKGIFIERSWASFLSHVETVKNMASDRSRCVWLSSMRHSKSASGRVKNLSPAIPTPLRISHRNVATEICFLRIALFFARYKTQKTEVDFFASTRRYIDFEMGQISILGPDLSWPYLGVEAKKSTFLGSIL